MFKSSNCLLETGEKKRTELDLDAKVDALSKFFDIMATLLSHFQANFPRSILNLIDTSRVPKNTSGKTGTHRTKVPWVLCSTINFQMTYGS